MPSRRQQSADRWRPFSEYLERLGTSSREEAGLPPAPDVRGRQLLGASAGAIDELTATAAQGCGVKE